MMISPSWKLTFAQVYKTPNDDNNESKYFGKCEEVLYACCNAYTKAVHQHEEHCNRRDNHT